MAESATEWYRSNPTEGLRWAVEFLVGDLNEQAARIRERADAEASFLEGKAALLRDIIASALTTSEG